MPLYRQENQHKEFSIDEKASIETNLASLRGVDGWLLFFCIVEGFFAPLYSALSLATLWRVVDLHPYPALQQIGSIATTMTCLNTVAGILVSIVIWRRSNRGKVIALWYLSIRVLAAIAFFSLILWWLARAGPVTNNVYFFKILGMLLRKSWPEFAWLAGWIGYFLFSRRVRNTYG